MLKVFLFFLTLCYAGSFSVAQDLPDFGPPDIAPPKASKGKKKPKSNPKKSLQQNTSNVSANDSTENTDSSDTEAGFLESLPLVGTFFKHSNQEESITITNKTESNTQNTASNEATPPISTYDGAFEAFYKQNTLDPNAPFPEKRPFRDYRTERQPFPIFNKSYTRENQHLPIARYVEEELAMLYHYIEEDDANVVRAFIKRFHSTEVRNKEGVTPLLYATMSGSIKSLMALLAMQANVNTKNIYGINPLYIASFQNRLDMVEALLSYRADVNITDNTGTSPLMIAASHNHAPIVETLLKHNADINQRKRDGNTALHLAIANAHPGMVQLLLTQGASLESRNFSGLTPLMLAATIGDPITVGVLLDAGANTDAQDAQGKTAESYANLHYHAHIAQQIASEIINRRLIAQRLLYHRTYKQYHNSVANADSKVTSTNTSFISKAPPPPTPIFKPYHIAQDDITIPKPIFRSLADAYNQWFTLKSIPTFSAPL